MSNKNIIKHAHTSSKRQRSQIKNQKPCVVWFTGLSGSGKSTLANAVEATLLTQGVHTYLLDGDNIRLGLNKGLGFSQSDRVENIRRIGEVSKLFVDAGIIVLTAFISPFRREREMVRLLVKQGEFIEIFVDSSLEVCEARDPKGLYKKARSGEIAEFTGISSPYEKPKKPELTIKNDSQALEQSVQLIIDYLKKGGYIDVK